PQVRHRVHLTVILKQARSAPVVCLTTAVSCWPQVADSGNGEKAYAVGRQLHWVVRPGIWYCKT
ncbi:MAG: hypothetical protein V3U73_04450, partial [bacterium]